MKHFLGISNFLEELSSLSHSIVSPYFFAAAPKLLQSCPTLREPMDCSLPGSSVHAIFQARVLEWGATAFSETRELPWGKAASSEIYRRAFWCQGTLFQLSGLQTHSIHSKWKAKPWLEPIATVFMSLFERISCKRQFTTQICLFARICVVLTSDAGYDPFQGTFNHWNILFEGSLPHFFFFLVRLHYKFYLKQVTYLFAY